jgi:RNA polymerase sigma-B factor
VSVGGSLAAYARPSVSGEIKRYVRDKRWQVHVKRRVQELRLDARRAEAELTQQLARSPRIGELARHLRVSEANVRDAERADQAFSVCSLDAPLPSGNGSCSLADLVGNDDSQLQQIIDLESVWAHWGELPRREQRLLLMRFYGNMTQAQISDELGISQMHVSRLLAGALGYLRQRITEAPGAPAG